MIRQATKYDMPVLIVMMREYSVQAPIEAIQKNESHNESHVAQLMTMMMAGKGFVLIDNENRGFLAAMIINNFWCPNVIQLNEIAWWVKPEHRESTVAPNAAPASKASPKIALRIRFAGILLFSKKCCFH